METLKSKLIHNYSQTNPLIIDGSILEGGGQILRISISLAYLLSIPIKINNIRSKRDNPGLQRQHLTCTIFITELYNSKNVSGLSLNSSEIFIEPTSLEILGNTNEINCKLNSAGSIGLMIQEILPCLLFSKAENNNFKIHLTGGTLCKFSPSIYYLNDVLFKLLKKYMNINVNCDLKRNGIYPIGCGSVILNVEKLNFINNINITNRGKFIGADIKFCYTNNFKFNIDKVCDAIYKNAKKIIRNEYIDENEENIFNESEIINEERISLGDKFYTFYYQIVMIYENTRIKGDYLLSEKKGNFNVDDIINSCNEATEYTVENNEVCLDEHTVDHLIIFMALAKGISKIQVGELSLHTKTAIEIVKKFNSDIKINVIPGDDKKYITNVIEIEGMGYEI